MQAQKILNEVIKMIKLLIVCNIIIKIVKREEIMDRSIRILNRIEPKNPILVAGWPGMGNVAYGAVTYLKESLKAVKFAEIVPNSIFYQTGVQIIDGIAGIPELPKSEFFYYKNEQGFNDLLILIGESQPVMEKEYELASMVIDFSLRYNVENLFTFAATPVNITHHINPNVWGVSTDKDIVNRFFNYGVKIMTAGHIGGLNGLLLGAGKKRGINGICFLGEIPFYTAKIENPKSSLAVLKCFMRYTLIDIDLSGLIQMARYVEEEIDRLSKTTKQTLFKEEQKRVESEKEEKIGTEKSGIPSEEREKIEYLFEAASKDISKAFELKKELDNWKVFQEYEDRFLDLFGKKNL